MLQLPGHFARLLVARLGSRQIPGLPQGVPFQRDRPISDLRVGELALQALDDLQARLALTEPEVAGRAIEQGKFQQHRARVGRDEVVEQGGAHPQLAQTHAVACLVVECALAVAAARELLHVCIEERLRALKLTEVVLAGTSDESRDVPSAGRRRRLAAQRVCLRQGLAVVARFEEGFESLRGTSLLAAGSDVTRVEVEVFFIFQQQQIPIVPLASGAGAAARGVAEWIPAILAQVAISDLVPTASD